MAKETFETSTSSSGSGSAVGVVEPSYDEKPGETRTVGQRALDSFKRNPDFRITQRGTVGANGQVYDLELAVQNTVQSPLARKLKGRHLQMIAIGGSIGKAYTQL